jgi:hypothetical protein
MIANPIRVRVALTALALSLGWVLPGFTQPGFKPVPASRCTLPVDSTIVLEFPPQSQPQTIELKSDPTNLPTVDTDKETNAHSMASKFVSLSQSGTFGPNTINSELDPIVPSTGKVDNVQQSGPGQFKKGHHTHNLFLQYTINKGKPNEVVMKNKAPIKIEADMDSTAPTGAVYRMVNGPITLVDSSNRPAAKLSSLENRVKRP